MDHEGTKDGVQHVETSACDSHLTQQVLTTLTMLLLVRRDMSDHVSIILHVTLTLVAVRVPTAAKYTVAQGMLRQNRAKKQSEKRQNLCWEVLRSSTHDIVLVGRPKLIPRQARPHGLPRFWEFVP